MTSISKASDASLPFAPRVAIYARYSSDRQSENSIEDQVRLCSRLVEREGWMVQRVFADAGISGAKSARPHYQELLAAVGSGEIDVVIAESLDRLSRDLEETARLFKQLQFAKVRLVTVSEGEVNELHIGLRGTMGAMYLKDLAEKTWRGLEGRVRDGYSGGGKAYGYRIVHEGADQAKGRREIAEDEAVVVREIFERYANGEGPRTIAKTLNARGVPGIDGRRWVDTTIRGHTKKGTGILNNELYIGKIIWNRQQYIRDPLTGNRVARMNPPSEWIVKEAPELRIIDDTLWQAVKQRQQKTSQARTDPYTTNPLNSTHRIKYMLSGILECGTCGGGYTIRAKDRYACSARANTGECSNSRTITRQDLEDRVLDAIAKRLVTPELVEVFVDEYRREWNRLQHERASTQKTRDKQLRDIDKRIANIMEAIERGVITETTKARLETLEREKAELERADAMLPLPQIHPNLAALYKRKVENLRDALAKPETAAAANNIFRSMIDKIVIHPRTEADDYDIEVYGELATLLGLNDETGRLQVSVVAGAGFEPATFRL